MDEALAEQQQAAYKMPGVNDDEPALDPTKKRKALEAENVCDECSDAKVGGAAMLNRYTGERKEAEERKVRRACQQSSLCHFTSQGCGRRRIVQELLALRCHRREHRRQQASH